MVLSEVYTLDSLQKMVPFIIWGRNPMTDPYYPGFGTQIVGCGKKVPLTIRDSHPKQLIIYSGYDHRTVSFSKMGNSL